MSKITNRVRATVQKALDEYGDEIQIIDRNNNVYALNAIARRPTFLVTADATMSEYYFLVSVDDFHRVQNGIGKEADPAPFFGDELIRYEGDEYVLRQSEPYEYYDGTRQVIRLWGTKRK